MLYRLVLDLRLLTLVCLFVLPAHLSASVKLITLPPRERVEVQLDNPNLTLVEEERLVPLRNDSGLTPTDWSHRGV